VSFPVELPLARTAIEILGVFFVFSALISLDFAIVISHHAPFVSSALNM